MAGPLATSLGVDCPEGHDLGWGSCCSSDNQVGQLALFWRRIWEGSASSCPSYIYPYQWPIFSVELNDRGPQEACGWSMPLRVHGVCFQIAWGIYITYSDGDCFQTTRCTLMTLLQTGHPGNSTLNESVALRDHFLAVSPWASYLTSWGCSSLISKAGKTSKSPYLIRLL